METKLERKLTEEETTVLQKCDFTPQTAGYIASLLTKKPLQKKATLTMKVVVGIIVLCIFAIPIALLLKWGILLGKLPEMALVERIVSIGTIIVYVASGTYLITGIYSAIHKVPDQMLFDTGNLMTFSNPWRQAAKAIPNLIVALLGFVISNWGLCVATSLIFVMTIVDIFVVIARIKARVKEIG